MMGTIRKFGLDYCDLPTMLWNVTILWRPLTLNINKRHPERIPIIFYIIGIIISVSCFYVYVISTAWFVLIKCSEKKDTTNAMVAISLGISSQIGTCKLFFMFLNKDKIRDLVEAYLDCNSIEIHAGRFPGQMQRTLRVVKKRAITYWLVIVLNGIIYVAKAIITPGRHLMDDSLILYGLEPLYESPNYEIAFVVSTFGAIFTCYVPATISALLIVTAGHSEAEMLFLSDKVENLWKDAQVYAKTKIRIITQNEKRYMSKIINKYVTRELADIVKKHTTNINLIQRIENIFRGAIALEFVLLAIALVAELLGGLENTYIEMPFALIQVAMDCLVGQRVLDASAAFENGVYNSKWENFDSANMKTVLIMLQNSQKTLKLSAGGMKMLSFASLMSVLKSIYSAYTTLRSAVK